MKNWKNILLTVLAAMMLVAFAAGIPSPSITEEARTAHMNEVFGLFLHSRYHPFLRCFIFFR